MWSEHCRQFIWQPLWVLAARCRAQNTTSIRAQPIRMRCVHIFPFRIWSDIIRSYMEMKLLIHDYVRANSAWQINAWSIRSWLLEIEKGRLLSISASLSLIVCWHINLSVSEIFVSVSFVHNGHSFQSVSTAARLTYVHVICTLSSRRMSLQ